MCSTRGLRRRQDLVVALSPGSYSGSKVPSHPPCRRRAAVDISATCPDILDVFGTLAAIWGLAGIGVLLGHAIYRLTLISLVGLSMPLHGYHWAALAGWALFMAYSEGYRGFQKSFSPRVAARAAYLWRHPTVLRALLAPFFCVGYFHIERRQQIVVVSITFVVIGFIIGADYLPQPWRGIVDLGVVIGLAWGLVALGVFTVQAFNGRLGHAPDVPSDG